eukprot:4202705-Pleurochrysis_carterae.AAC.1
MAQKANGPEAQRGRRMSIKTNDILYYSRVMWRHTDKKRKKGVTALLRSWTVEMMNCARIQMKTWVATKNEHKANVRRRWDNRGKMNKAFQRWKTR